MPVEQIQFSIFVTILYIEQCEIIKNKMELEDKMEKSQLCAPRDKKHKDWETDFL